MECMCSIDADKTPGSRRTQGLYAPLHASSPTKPPSSPCLPSVWAARLPAPARGCPTLPPFQLGCDSSEELTLRGATVAPRKGRAHKKAAHPL